MAKEQKQSIDLRPGKRFGVGLSNENLRIGASSAWEAKIAGTLDESRSKLDFEIGKGGVVTEIDKSRSISKRIKAILSANGISDPNVGLDDEQLKQKGVGVRTYASFVLQGSHDTMVNLAFGDQSVSFKPNADNSHLTRNENIEKWAKDMYAFVAQKYGEENIAAFVVHLDETTPHAHCVVVPINERGRLSFKDVFAGKDKYEFSKRTKSLWDEASVIAEKYGMKRGDDSLATGAKHKSYLQWMREQIQEKEVTIDEQNTTIQQQDSTITTQKQQLYEINGEIRKAEKKLKSLSSMISNLEEQKTNLEGQIAALEDVYAENDKELADKRQELYEKVAEIDEKIADKRNKLEEASEQLRELGKKRLEIKKNYDQLQRDINRDLPTLLDRTQRDINSTMYEEAAREMKKDYSSLTQFAEKLTPDLRKEFDDILEGSFFEDICQRGNEIAGVAAALYLGYIDQATSFAHGSGGGGGGPGSGWGRDKDEDDEAYRRRCCIMGRMMMKPPGRKLKRT